MLKKIENRLTNFFLKLIRKPSEFVKRFKHLIYIQINNINFFNGYKKNSDYAVVIHLYYTESWSLLFESISRLNTNFDLFVTIPKQNKFFISQIKKDIKNSKVILVPNQGRDVLPFLYVANKLYKRGYKYILKLHSKKSTHRSDGSAWLENMVNSLLPKNKQLMKKIYKIIEDKKTAIIGPADQYLSLKVNFDANGLYMDRILRKIFTVEIVNKVLQTNREDYGFFAGTMFWVRLDAIAPILKIGLNSLDFETEKGQIDGTLAHALERLFCLVPEFNKKLIYEIKTKDVLKVDYNNGTIPDWSNVYIGPKS